MTLQARIDLQAGSLRVDCSLAAEPGRTLVLTGPNGAGKTTILRALCGLNPLERGRIALDGSVLDEPAKPILVPPERRDIGIVFQDSVLFPHLSALDNVAFGLRAKNRMSRAAARESAAAALRDAGLGPAAALRPSQLSGGQARRVALARALAPKPRVLLLDEPLAPLDAESRPGVRRELQARLAEHQGIRIVVTHDPVEALSMGDRIAVLENGRVTQEGTPAELRAHPKTAYVARFLGLNLFRGIASQGILKVGEATIAIGDATIHGEAIAIVSPTAVALHRLRPEGSPRNIFRTRIEEILDEGTRLRVHLVGPLTLTAEITPGAAADLQLHKGDEVYASVKATEIEARPA